jgi:hypothetical protein
MKKWVGGKRGRGQPRFFVIFCFLFRWGGEGSFSFQEIKDKAILFFL